jgi:hypothetical protein
MKKSISSVVAVVTASVFTVSSLGAAWACRRPPIPRTSIVQRVASMVMNHRTRMLAARHGLQVLNVLWEDTGRWQGSAVGPNISDVTIEVEDKTFGNTRALMPVLRFPNFKDKTADVKLDQFFLRVGNEQEGRRAKTISLRDFLAHPSRYLSLPNKGNIKGGTLLAERDTHALVSAQAAFLPIPPSGKASFYPVIFNYQSSAKNPAVLTLLVTRQGTSATIVDNARDTVGGGRSWGQRLFFNKAGQRAPLTAERLADVRANGVTSNGESAASLVDDANLLMLVQVPLKYRTRPRRMAFAVPSLALGSLKQSSKPMEGLGGDAQMDTAVLGHGPTEGPYTELDGLTIERDERFPVRVTVQFYQAVSSPNLGDAEVAKLASQIGKVYEKGDYVGSLVVPGPGDTRRPTNWIGVSPAPATSSPQHFPGLLERFTKYGVRFPFLFGI